MEASAFPVLSVGAAQEGPYLQRIFEGEIGGVIVSDVLSSDECAAWTARLDAGRLSVSPTRFAAEFDAFSFGPCLDQCEGRLDEYLTRVRPFEEALEDAVPGIDVPARVLTTLARIAAGRPPMRPSASDGRPYALLTLRRLPPGGLIPPHCENEQLPRAAYRDLRPRIETTTLVSFYLTLRPADSGGELAVHAIDHTAIGGRTRHGHSDLSEDVARTPHVSFKPDAGSLIVFDGGRRFHQVRPVGGVRARWTLGGFLARSRSRDAFYAWA